jgi:NAD(P)-dependent dehydrogenase (short-subunit alcohol dehydrogenase family)
MLAPMTAGDKQRIAVITGASRREGIGFEVARQLGARGFTVVVTARTGATAASRVADLVRERLDAVAETLDVADPTSVTAFASRMQERFGRVDLLVNNAAGISAFGEKPSSADLRAAHDAMESTLFGAWRTTQALLPLLRRSKHARVVMVSSGAGSHGDMVFGLTSGNAMGPSYGVPKAALNALAAAFAAELRRDGILVNAVCPGFTATFPGAERMGARPVTDGAASIVWAATLPDDGPTGGFFRDGKPLPW